LRTLIDKRFQLFAEQIESINGKLDEANDNIKKKNSEDIKQNSQDIKKNSEDILAIKKLTTRKCVSLFPFLFKSCSP